MPVLFNSILKQVDIDPAHVILLRHQDKKAAPARTPYDLWRDNPSAFDLYQSIQSFDNRPKFVRAPIWASFVVTPGGATMFVGIYYASYRSVLAEDTPNPHNDGVERAGTCDTYDVRLDDKLSDISGRLYVDWGDGTRAWIQRADNQNKEVVELHPEFKEPEFPGLLNFIAHVSEIPGMYKNWVSVLQEARGVYLLSCPRTREQYVGSACGSEGFWQRWQNYASDGHGGNIALMSREPSDYQVSILEVAGSASTDNDILQMESRWKTKLQSREMGLNKN